MYITDMELAKQKLAANGAITDSLFLKRLIEGDRVSTAKQQMRDGERYYRGEHDILQHDFTTAYVHETEGYGSEAREVVREIENKNNANHHNVHNYYGLQVDQKASYILGKPPSVTVEGAKSGNDLKQFENAVTAVSSDERFCDILSDYIVGGSNKGCEWLHVYYDKDDKLQHSVISALECIPFYDSSRQQHLTDMIRYYEIDDEEAEGSKTRTRVEWWTGSQVTYYLENAEGDFLLDDTVKPNPCAHWQDITVTDGVPVKREQGSWGRVPFIPLRNNRGSTGDLARVKSLQDAYNMISSASTNNQIDLVELYWIIQGYDGESAKAIAKKLRMNKAVNITDADGKVSAEQVTLGVQERIAWLELLRRDIYHLGMAVDTDADKFGNAPSGVSLKFQYTLLDMKANTLISKLKQAMKEFFWFVTEDINRRQKTNYDSSLVRFDVNKSIITNDMEAVQIITQSADIVPETILLAKHPLVDDVNQAMADMQAQREQAGRLRKALLNDDQPYEDNAQ